eukprot:1737558-Lingulodinium_polyedra.AAC.1
MCIRDSSTHEASVQHPHDLAACEGRPLPASMHSHGLAKRCACGPRMKHKWCAQESEAPPTGGLPAGHRAVSLPPRPRLSPVAQGRGVGGGYSRAFGPRVGRHLDRAL